jgi:plasmid stabilization system protein ParE
MIVRISEQAEEDLAQIYARIEARDPEAADRFKREAEKALALLAQHPELGPRPGWETRHPKLRFWVISHFQNYLIYYEAGEVEISIERVLNGRRDVRRIVENGSEDG